MLKLLVVALLAMSTSAFAQKNATGSDSCGLGWQVTQKKTMSATTTRGTTNSVVPNTFGMTSGTLGCDQHSLVKAEMKTLHYADANYENLMTEIAEGQGEYLNGFIRAMGCSPSAHMTGAFQANYVEISSGATPGELVRKVQAIIRQTGSCQA